MTRPSFEPGQKAVWTKTISESDVYAFAGITGDFNPLHVDREYAAKTRFGERIGHGMLTAGLISAVLGMMLPGPGGVFMSQSLKFVKPVRFGDTITAEAEVLSYRRDRGILTLKTTCRNQRGETVIEGEAVIMVEEREKPT